jgi:hypothetical protein
MAKIKYVIKRNGATVPFSQDRITDAIYHTQSRSREVPGLSRCADWIVFSDNMTVIVLQF